MKPCPFCGSEQNRSESWLVAEGTRHEHKQYTRLCLNCGATGPNDLGWSGADEMWNLRRPSDELLEALRKIQTVIGARGCTNKGYYIQMAGEYCGMVDKIAAAALAKAEGRDA